MIDGRDAGAWEFPIGTQAWKEFRFGRWVETRYRERLQDGAWRYAAYLWSEGADDAVLAPREGVRGACESGFGTLHDVGRGRQLLPSMPTGPLGTLGDDDLRAMFAFLKSIPTIQNRVPDPLPPAQE